MLDIAVLNDGFPILMREVCKLEGRRSGDSGILGRQG